MENENTIAETQEEVKGETKTLETAEPKKEAAFIGTTWAGDHDHPVSDAPTESHEVEKSSDSTTGSQEVEKMIRGDKMFVAVRQIMEVKNQINKIETAKNLAIDRVKTMLPDDKLSILESRAVYLNPDVIAQLDMNKKEDWEKVKAVYTFEDGSMIHFTGDPDPDNIKVREMHRDYLVYLRKIDEETKKFEETQTKIKADLDQLYKELDEIVGEENANKVRNYASFSDYYRDWIKEQLEKDDTNPKAREYLEKVLAADDEGIYLGFLFKEVEDLLKKKGNSDSLFYGYRHNFSSIAHKAGSVLASKFSKYNYHISFTKFWDVEEKHFQHEIGAEYNNLFMFILFRFIKFNYEKFDTFWMITLGEIVTQLAFLDKDPHERPESNATFREKVVELLKYTIEHTTSYQTVTK